jgi:DNA mismatch repair protein MSH3
VTTPASVGLESPVLNEIISSFPTLREPIKDLLAAVNLKKASAGKMDSMWTDLERYPSIIDADMVRVCSSIERFD